MAANAYPRKLPFGHRHPHHPSSPSPKIVTIDLSDDDPPPQKRSKLLETQSQPVSFLPVVKETRNEKDFIQSLGNSDLERLRGMCEAEEIPEKFVRLVLKCGELAGRPINESKVVKALQRFSGDVSSTLDYFHGKHPR